MNTVLLLLQLVVTAGAAAQPAPCSILSEISATASAAAAALATASNIANVLAAAASGTLPDFICLTACNKACKAGCALVPSGTGQQPLLNCCAGWLGTSADLASLQASCDSAVASWCPTSGPDDKFCSDLASAQSIAQAAASPLSTLASLCKTAASFPSGDWPSTACDSDCNNHCSSSCGAAFPTATAGPLAPLANCAASLLGTAADSLSADADCASSLQAFTCEECPP